MTGDEQEHLTGWYGRKDDEEDLLLTRPSSQTTLIPTLQSEVETTLSELLAATQRIQTLTEENKSLRREIASLHEQLAREQSLQAA